VTIHHAEKQTLWSLTSGGLVEQVIRSKHYTVNCNVITYSSNSKDVKNAEMVRIHVYCQLREVKLKECPFKTHVHLYYLLC